MDDKKNGIGIDNLPNGSKYVGEFKHDKFNGQGIVYLEGGKIEESGVYENDRLIKSGYVDPNSFSRIAK